MGRFSLEPWRGLLLFAVLAVMPACAPDRGPDLLQIEEVTPHAVERGTHLELAGAGFPDRRTAQVAFVGKVHRPGEPPRAVSVRTTARADSRSHLTLAVGGELLERFLDGAPHGTFRGSVVVAFAARSADAPPLGGKLDGIVMDFFGDAAERRGAEAELGKEGKAFADFLGIRLNESFEITELSAHGEGERAGLAIGDRVIALDGVRLDAEGDLAPRPDGRSSEISVRRAGLGELVRPLDRTGFRPLRLSDLALSTGLVAAAVTLLAFSFGRGARAWAFLETCLLARLERARKASGGRSLGFAPLLGTRSTTALLPLGLRWVPYAGFFAVSAALSALALGQPLLDGEGALPVLLSSIGAASAIGAFARGGRSATSAHGRRGFSLSKGLGAGAQALLLFLPIALATGSAIYADGSLRLGDLVASQGGTPGEWRALETPWSLFGFALLLAALVPEGGANQGPVLEATLPAREEDAQGARATSRSVSWVTAELLDLLALALSSGLGATIFLGGWSVPGHAPHPLLGAALLLLKTWALLCAALLARQVLGARRSEIWAPWVRWSLPLALGCFAVQVVATGSGWLHAHEAALGLSARALLVCVGGYALARSIHLARRGLPTLAINPWL